MASPQRRRTYRPKRYEPYKKIYSNSDKSKNRLEFEELLEEGRRDWTPWHVFGACCVKWLVDGPLKHPTDETHEWGSPRNGCDGRCRRGHPCITLEFDSDQNATIAILSHALDPFVQYFEHLAEEGLARRLSWNTYIINDYLKRFEDGIRSYDGFGSHLVVVKEGSRESSLEAHKSELENNETREIERRRIKDIGGIHKSLFEKVADIVLNQPMIQGDLVALDSLSKSCKFFRDEVTSIATRKMETLKLSATVHLGRTRTTLSMSRIVRIPLTFQRCGSDGGWYHPNIDPPTVSWDTGFLDRRDVYHGNYIRVHWHPDAVDIDYIQSVEPDLGVELARYSLLRCPRIPKKETSHQGVVTISCGGVTIKYQIVENVTYSGSDRRLHRYSGEVKLIKAKVDFGALVREHARRASKELSEEQKHIVQVRPLLQREEDYRDYLKSIIGPG